MKFRTDFVTNSSSSSFVLEICIDLENGKSLKFEANGGTGETGIIDYFWSDATVTVSPKQLGCAKSVQELIDLRTRDLIFEPVGIAILHGKGGKTRRVPLEKNTVQLLKQYFSDQKLDRVGNTVVFTGNRGNKLTREGVTYIISKYVEPARREMSSIPERITPHVFRHTRAMVLLQAGVSLIYIRDFLGHTDVKTTEIYAKTDTELKRKAIEGTMPSVFDDSNKKDWTENTSLMEWLNGLC